MPFLRVNFSPKIGMENRQTKAIELLKIALTIPQKKIHVALPVI